MNSNTTGIQRQFRKPLVLLTLFALLLLPYLSTLRREGKVNDKVNDRVSEYYSGDKEEEPQLSPMATNLEGEGDQLTTLVLEEGRHKGDEESGVKDTQSRNTSVYRQRNQIILNDSLPPLEIRFDKRRRYVQLWRKDAECSSLKVEFAKSRMFPKCALASYPGSGNTWLRKLIEEASGVFTGSVYDDGQLFLGAYYGELEPWYAGTTIVQKSHGFEPDAVKQFRGRGVVLLRNPYRAIVAYHNFMFAGHRMYAPVSNYRRKDWPAFAHLQTKHWLETIMNWVIRGDTLHIVHYEHLRQNPTNELRRILEFLRAPVDEKRFHCMKKHMYKGFRRKEQRFPASLAIFGNETRDKIDRAIRYASFLLQNHGREPLPTQLYEFYNGTSSSEVISVPCKEDEGVVDCDARVDDINVRIGVEMNKKFASINGRRYVTKENGNQLLTLQL